MDADPQTAYTDLNSKRPMTDLFSRFLADAERLIDEDYNDFSRLDPSDLDWYAERLTEANYDEMMDDIRLTAAMVM